MSYNSSGEIADLLDSLSRLEPPADEVIVLDNGSTDDSTTIVRRHSLATVLVEAEENLGFAKGVNRAAERATSDLILLVNPDAVVFDDTLSHLLDAVERFPNAGLIGGRAVHADGTTDPASCWGPTTLWSHLCFGLGLSVVFRGTSVFDPESYGSWDRDEDRAVATITGCLLLAPQSVWRRLGGFDERFWLYGEDVDICHRARRLGYEPMIAHRARTLHPPGASSESSAWRLQRTLQGKMTLARTMPDRRFDSLLRRALILAGVRLRSLSLFDKFSARATGSEVWRAAWSARADWRRGY